MANSNIGTEPGSFRLYGPVPDGYMEATPSWTGATREPCAGQRWFDDHEGMTKHPESLLSHIFQHHSSI